MSGGSVARTNTAFGADPVYGVAEGRYPAPAGGPAGSTACATGNTPCTPGTLRTVVYGARGAFYARRETGPFPCTSASFGGDPVPGVAKSCYLN